MTVDTFFELFILELKENQNLRKYYKFLNDNDPAKYNFRKRYFIQRLNYIFSHIKKESQVWDCGCGYGTTAIFLALNGHTVYGNTLEFYYEQIEPRLAYWKKHGDLTQLNFDYKNHFDINFSGKYDYVIAQDTLHHLEPLNEALQIISKALKPNGKLIAIEENGTNIFNSFKNYLKRGNKRVKEMYDEKLQRTFLLGDENTRSLKKWIPILQKENLYIEKESVIYVRLFLHPFYKWINVEKIDTLEQKLWKNFILRKYFYFGINFTAIKTN